MKTDEGRPRLVSDGAPHSTRSTAHLITRRNVALVDAASLAAFAIVGGLVTAQLCIDHVHAWPIVGGICLVTIVLLAVES